MKSKICQSLTGTKKLFLLVLCMGITFSVAACNSGRSTAAENITSVVEKNMDKGYIFSIKNTEFIIGEDPTDKIEKLGETSDSFSAPSCAMQGEDKIYTYSGFALTANLESKDSPARLISILLTDDSVQTKEGLYIGQTRKNVEKIYGKKKEKENEYIYKKGRMELSIIFEGDKVVSIEYRG